MSIVVISAILQNDANTNIKSEHPNIILNIVFNAFTILHAPFLYMFILLQNREFCLQLNCSFRAPLQPHIVCLPGQSGDVLSSDPSLTERMMLMSTYEEFMVILTVCLLIVAILNLKNKK